ncbi:MAG: hypothetical protein IPM33_02485 [Phycisphaerales bacterium]|nr:hypothetical protein [Phycisphaerales bacterium]
MRPFVLLLVLALLPGCIAVGTPRGGATLSTRDALAALKQMEQNPVPHQRPLVILNGYRSPEFLLGALRSRLGHATSGNTRDVLVINFFTDSTFDQMADRTLREINAKWPSADPHTSVEVDVVGVSMGGLVARYAALPHVPDADAPAGETDAMRPRRPVLNLKRLFTLATPHRGASIARWIAIDEPARDMREGSAFLARLDAALPQATYEIVAYAHLRDITVGATHTAPPETIPIWTGGTLLFSHGSTAQDVVLIADLARRIRGEPPLLHADQPPPRN